MAKLIARILFKDQTKRETYNVCSADHRTWEEIAEYYHRLVGLEAVWVDKEDYLAILSPEGNIPKDYIPQDTPAGIRMDEYIQKHHL